MEVAKAFSRRVSLNVCLSGWLASLPGGRWVFCRTEVSVVWSTVSRVRRGVWRQSSTATCEDLFCQSTITNVQSQFIQRRLLSPLLSLPGPSFFLNPDTPPHPRLFVPVLTPLVFTETRRVC